MEALKALAIRRLPKLCRRISTEAAADLPAPSASCRPGMQAFAPALNKRLADDAGSQNLIFSPVSIYAALSLVAAGSRERTLSELLGVLGAPSRDELARSVRALAGQALADRSRTGGPRVTFACSVWHDKMTPLKPSYVDAVVKEYKAQTRAVDLHRKPEETGKAINAWVAASTKKLITEIVDPSRLLPEATDLVLANAVYFKGKWQHPFAKNDTKADKFHRLDGSTVDVPFMRDSRRSRTHRIACHDGFKVLQLRYEQGWSPDALYSMCVFLPDARDGLSRLTDRIAGDPEFLHNHLPTSTVQVRDFRLPKFKLDFSTGMEAVLRDMGISEVFQLGTADFSDMVAEDGLGSSLADVWHRAVIEVNEEGTRAVAVAAPRMKGRGRACRPPALVDFVADHPFAFFVIEELSGAILFAGHVLDPSN